MAYRDDKFQGDEGAFLDNLWSVAREGVRRWDHANGGRDGQSNKQVYLLAQKFEGSDIEAGPSGLNHALAVLLHAAADRILYPGR
jgi:hypothetical protein